MPASMISPVTGSRPSVRGMRTATPVVEPSPGRTPITVPARTPMKQKSRFSTVSAVEKPRTRLSITSATDPDQARGQRHAQEEDEHHVDERHRTEGDHRGRHPRAALDDTGDEEGQYEEGDEEAEHRDEQQRDDQG